MPGFGGKVLAKSGAAALQIAGGEIYTSLERGVIDATEWIGPYHDYLMGFQNIAKYYYYPGWHEVGPVLEMIINKEKFDVLPDEFKSIVRGAAAIINTWMTAEFHLKNGIYLNKIKKESQVQIKFFPTDVLDALKQNTAKVIADMIKKDPVTREVYQSFSDFQKTIKPWMESSEKVYYEKIL